MLHDKHWLSIYELSLKGWGTTNLKAIVNSDPFFSTLNKGGVSFFDSKREGKLLNLGMDLDNHEEFDEVAEFAEYYS